MKLFGFVHLLLLVDLGGFIVVSFVCITFLFCSPSFPRDQSQSHKEGNMLLLSDLLGATSLETRGAAATSAETTTSASGKTSSSNGSKTANSFSIHNSRVK